MESLQVVMEPPQAAVFATPADVERIFREHHATILRAAFRVTGSATDAEDVLQTVFLRMLRRPAGFPAMENVAGYLRRSAVNAALDLVRERQAAKEAPIEKSASTLRAAPAMAPDRLHEAREMRELIRRSLGRVPPRAAEVFALHYFEGYSNPEIAQALDITSAGVAVTLHRVRARIQEEIRNMLGEAS